MLAALLVLGTGPAWADAGPKIANGWYVPMGVSLAAAIRESGGRGFALGGEVSVVHLDMDSGLWYGAYLDAIGDFGSRALRMSAGPELGVSIVGFDAGALLEVVDGRVREGFQLRMLLTLGLVAVYGRWAHVFGDIEADDVGEVGLLIKVGIPVKVEPGWGLGRPSGGQPERGAGPS
jgi:hypothetical protein